MRDSVHNLGMVGCFVAFVGCYTILSTTPAPRAASRGQENSKRDVQPLTSIVEGLVEYHGSGNTEETNYHEGFILTHRVWIVNPPSRERQVVYLTGSIDSSLLYKRVRIEGTYYIPERQPNRQGHAPDYTSDMYVRIAKLQVLE